MKNQLGIEIGQLRFWKNTVSSELLFKIANYFEFDVSELFALSGKIAVNMEKGI